MRKLLMMASAMLLSLGFMACGGDDETLDENMVDMGTSVKWHRYNLGATSESQAGDYFQWGSTTPSDYRGSINMIDLYNDNGVIKSQKDAANTILGDGWRIPTPTEFKELLDSCTTKLTTMDDVKGLLLTSKSTGNTLFFPATGYMSKTLLTEKEMKDVGSAGYYWSCYFNKEEGKAMRFTYNSSKIKTEYGSVLDGCFIRPVKY